MEIVTDGPTMSSTSSGHSAQPPSTTSTNHSFKASRAVSVTEEELARIKAQHHGAMHRRRGSVIRRSDVASSRLQERLKEKKKKHNIITHLKEVKQREAEMGEQGAAPTPPPKKKEKLMRAMKSELENIKAIHVGAAMRRRGSMMGRSDRASTKLQMRLEEKKR